MEEVDFRKVCIQLKERLPLSFIERIERRVGQDFEETLREKPEQLLTNILQDIQLYYVRPFEIALELSAYLRSVHDIAQFSLALSEAYDFPISEKIDEAHKIVNTFYEMTDRLGFEKVFTRETEEWWIKG
jgi:hypothetical protein